MAHATLTAAARFCHPPPFWISGGTPPKCACTSNQSTAVLQPKHAKCEAHDGSRVVPMICCNKCVEGKNTWRCTDCYLGFSLSISSVLASHKGSTAHMGILELHQLLRSDWRRRAVESSPPSFLTCVGSDPPRYLHAERCPFCYDCGDNSGNLPSLSPMLLSPKNSPVVQPRIEREELNMVVGACHPVEQPSSLLRLSRCIPSSTTWVAQMTSSVGSTGGYLPTTK